MPVVPRLKSLTCVSLGDRLVASLDPRRRVELGDDDGAIRTLLILLAEGSRTVDELAVEVSRRGFPTTTDELSYVLKGLDDLGWVDNASGAKVLTDWQRERFHSNLAFFDAFTSLQQDREPLQARLIDANVVVLGAGGLGSCVLQSLAGYGVGRLTLLDHDRVEWRNFARQFTYFPDQLGQPKVQRVADWVRAFHPQTQVTAVEALVDGPEAVARLLDGVDVLVSAIDTPDEVDLWVNEACVGAGVPFIRAGLAYVQGLYWSVDPGRSACRHCLERHRESLGEGVDAMVVQGERVLQAPTVNRAIGPIAQILGGLAALEVLRYVTRVAPPVSAATYRLIDFDGGCDTSSDPWPQDPSCPVCATAPTVTGAARLTPRVRVRP